MRSTSASQPHLRPSHAALPSTSSTTRSFLFTSSQGSVVHEPSTDASALQLEECTDASDLLRFLLTFRCTLSHSADGLRNRTEGIPADAYVASLFLRDGAPALSPRLWDAQPMLQARQAVAAHLAGVVHPSSKTRGADPAFPSLADFLLYLVVREQDILRDVRHRRSSTDSTSTTTMSSEKLQTGMSDTSTSSTDKHPLTPGFAEHAALTFLTRCTSYLVYGQRHREAKKATTGDSGGDTETVGTSAGTSTAINRLGCPLCSISALDLLRASSSAIAASASPTRSTGDSDCPAPYWCSTGCDGLDRALGGAGFRSGWVTEIYGEAGAGKTQLGLQCLLQQSAIDVCRSAVALALHRNTDFQVLLRQDTGTTAQRCRDVFDRACVERTRCAVFYLVSEDVPTSRLGPLAAAAVRRAVRSTSLHPLLAQLPTAIAEAVRCGVRQTCTVAVVLSRLQVRHIASVAEVVRLLTSAEASTTIPTTAAGGVGASGGGTVSRDQPSPCGSLQRAVRMLAGSQERALIVLDSIAAAVLAGQSDMRGAPQTDASVATVATLLRAAAAQHRWCVLVTNQVRAVPSSVRLLWHTSSSASMKRARSPPSTASSSGGGSGGQAVVPALGLSWAAVAPCRVQLRKSASLGVRQLVLRYAPSQPPSQVSYVITENGIEDA